MQLKSKIGIHCARVQGAPEYMSDIYLFMYYYDALICCSTQTHEETVSSVPWLGRSGGVSESDVILGVCGHIF